MHENVCLLGAEGLNRQPAPQAAVVVVFAAVPTNTTTIATRSIMEEVS